MDYVLATDRPFDEIEAQTIEALERQGLMVQRTFSLRSAVGVDRGDTNSLTSHEYGSAEGDKPDYSVLMIYAAGSLQRPLGLITLYERGDRIVIKPVLSPEDHQQFSTVEARDAAAGAGSDVNGELVAALVRGGLDLCVDVANGEQPTDPLPG